jgi:hypothetical protein
MTHAGVFGRQACPRGLRHGFGVGSLQNGVPLNLIQRWMGHARLSTTAIYANVWGPEEMAFAQRFWAGGMTGGSRADVPFRRGTRMSVRSATDLDRLIGANIRRHRVPAGWTQSQLGDTVGLTFQQIQKYEAGKVAWPRVHYSS